MFFFFKAIFSSLALWWSLRQINFDHLHIVFKELPVTIYSYTLLAMCLCVSLNGLRLYYISQKIGLKNSLTFLHQLTWAGTFFNQLLPSGIGGDAYRIYALSKKNGALLSTSAIIWDRILGISCMGLICVPMLFFINMPTPLKIITITVYGFLMSGIVILALFIKFPVLQNYKLIKTLWNALAYGKNIFCAPFGYLSTASITSALMNFLAFYMLIIALKIPLNFWESSVLYTISLLVTLIPLSISGWGLRESFLTAYLLACGLPPEKGFTLGVLQGLLMLATGGIGAIFYLFSKNQKISLGTSPQNR
jgi:uncharacterized membrane protein YbhN (UPF0104 family)